MKILKNKKSGAEFPVTEAEYQDMVDKGYMNKYTVTEIEKKTRESMIPNLPAEILAKRKTVEAVESELTDHEKPKRGRKTLSNPNN